MVHHSPGSALVAVGLLLVVVAQWTSQPTVLFSTATVASVLPKVAMTSGLHDKAMTKAVPRAVMAAQYRETGRRACGTKQWVEVRKSLKGIVEGEGKAVARAGMKRARSNRARGKGSRQARPGATIDTGRQQRSEFPRENTVVGPADTAPLPVCGRADFSLDQLLEDNDEEFCRRRAGRDVADYHAWTQQHFPRTP
eukprot:GGOE01045865.1.p1 GENE.GGOE01045865.1~~GGOE01045865.1.p1  ORF type:complete len:196 (-),score=15.98 GGOE01045865.1:112-699(-)